MTWVVAVQNPDNIPCIPDFLVEADRNTAVSPGMNPEQFANYLRTTVQENVHGQFR